LFGSGLRAGLLTFGGAYTAIPFLRNDAVERGRWMSERDFLDGVALSGILPAPLIIFSTFVGYFGGGPVGALAMTLARYPKLEVRLQLDDGEVVSQTTAMTAVMNGRAFGGSFHVCPDACADDGELDLLIADGVGRLAILGLVPKIMRGAHAGDPRLRLERARKVTIESEVPLLVEADGEIAFEDARRRFEREYLTQLLKITEGNVTQAARLAKRNRTEFYKLLGRHQLDPKLFKSR